MKPYVVSFELKPEVATEATYEYLLTTTSMVIMDPYQHGALMRSTASFSYKELSSKADTLIDTVASLKFVSKEFGMAYGFYKDCKTISKLSIRDASEQRISTTISILSYGLYH